LTINTLTTPNIQTGILFLNPERTVLRTVVVGESDRRKGAAEVRPREKTNDPTPMSI